MAGTTFYLPLEVAPSSREGKSGKITPARISHHRQAQLSPSQAGNAASSPCSELAQQCSSATSSQEGQSYKDFWGARTTLPWEGVKLCMCVRQVWCCILTHRHPNLRALAKKHQDTSAHTPCLCLSKHWPQLCTQHHLDQAGVVRSQISKHYEAGGFFAGRCSYNILKTTSAFQPRLSEGETSACEACLE